MTGHGPLVTSEQLASRPDTRPGSLGRVVVLAILTALSVGTVAQAHPLTTRPSLALDVRVTITDMRIVLDRRSAPRGVDARFHIRNAGAKTHNFTLSGPKFGNRQQGFSRTLKPGQNVNVRLFLEVRARQPYFSRLTADRFKPGMRGTFVTR